MEVSLPCGEVEHEDVTEIVSLLLGDEEYDKSPVVLGEGQAEADCENELEEDGDSVDETETETVSD